MAGCRHDGDLKIRFIFRDPVSESGQRHYAAPYATYASLVLSPGQAERSEDDGDGDSGQGWNVCLDGRAEGSGWQSLGFRGVGVGVGAGVSLGHDV